MPPTRRERVRDATLREIKEVARAHLRTHGPSGVSLRGIARDIGMTAPALYRYYAGLDELLTAMIESYKDEMGDALVAARDALPPGDPGGRLVAMARAFRLWALEHGPEFAMVFGSPVPGLAESGPSEAGTRLGRLFFEVFTALWHRAPFPVPSEEDIASGLRRELRVFAAACGAERAGVPLGAVRMFATAWVRLYGIVAMEVFGHTHFMVDDAEPLFDAELADILASVGISR